jgi:PAS domain S-box-containing protein
VLPSWTFPRKLGSVRVLAAALVLFSFVVVVLFTVANQGDDGTIDLKGSYRLLRGGRPGVEQRIKIPGLFGSDLPKNPLVEIEIPVSLEPGVLAASDDDEGRPRLAVLLARVRYAVEARWDGHVIGRHGTLGATSASQRSDQALVAAIPAELATAGPHVLDIRAEGAYGEGGVLGEVRLGKADAVWARLRRYDLQELGLVLAAAFIAVLQFAVVIRRPDRKDHLVFGLFFFSLAVFLFARSDSWYLLFQDLGWRLRIRRFGYLATAGFVLPLVSYFAMERSGRMARWMLVTCLSIGTLAFVTPDLTLNALANTIGDALLMASMGLSLVYLLAALRKDRLPAVIMILALIVATVPTFLDISITKGLSQGTNFLLPSLFLVAGAMGTSMMVKFTDGYTRYQSLMSGAPDAVILVDGLDRVEEANPAAKSLLGIGADEPALLQDLVEASVWKRVSRHLSRVRTQRLDRTELQLRGGDREIWVESVGSRLDEDKILVVLRDITDRRSVEDRLVSALRLETVGRLARGVAEEVVSVLHQLLTDLGLLRPRVPKECRVGEASAAQHLENMELAIHSASGLARQLGDVSRGGSGLREPVDIAGLAQSTARMVKVNLPPNTSLRVEIPDGIPPVLADPADLRQALLSLLLNARDAVAAKNGDEGQGEIVISARSTMLGSGVAGVLVAVDDNGAGVPLEQRLRVFDAFFSTKGPTEGTGLGLTVVWNIVRAHQGEVSVGESISGGASVRIRLPLGRQADGTSVERSRGNRILLVEDEHDLRESMQEALAKEGYQVASANSVSQARETWKAVAGAIDLLVVDVLLGADSGLELAAALQRERDGLRVILLSGFIPQEQVPQVAEGRWALLEKPFRTELFTATVRHTLRPTEIRL